MNGVLALIRSQPYYTMAVTACIASLATQYFNFSQAGYGQTMAVRMTALLFVNILVGIGCAVAGFWQNMGVYALPFREWFEHVGLTMLHGAIGAGLFFCLLCKLMGLDIGEMCSVSVASIAVFFSIGRIGCWFAGCCYGRPMVFTLLGYHFTRFPTQLAESLFFLLLFILLQLFIKKRRIPVVVLSYSVFRFFIEFLRGDDRGTLIPGSPLSPAQTIALALATVTLGALLYRRIKINRSGQASVPAVIDTARKENARI